MEYTPKFQRMTIITKKKNKFIVIEKALNGLKQTDSMWFNEISKFFKSIGFIQY